MKGTPSRGKHMKTRVIRCVDVAVDHIMSEKRDVQHVVSEQKHEFEHTIGRRNR